MLYNYTSIQRGFTPKSKSILPQVTDLYNMCGIISLKHFSLKKTTQIGNTNHPKNGPQKIPKETWTRTYLFFVQRRWLEGAWHRNSTCLAIWSLGTLLGIVGETRCFVFCWLIEVTSRLQKMKSHRIYCMFHFLVYLCATSYQWYMAGNKKIKKKNNNNVKCCMFNVCRLLFVSVCSFWRASIYTYLYM